MQIIRDRRRIDRTLTTYDTQSNIGGSSVLQTREAAASTADAAAGASDAGYSWAKAMQFIRRYIRADRDAIINEQQTAKYWNPLLAADVSPLAFRSVVWVYMNDAFYSTLTTYPVYNSHLLKSDRDACTVWVSPQTADYDFSLYFEAISADAALDDYVMLVMSVYDIKTGAWRTPFYVGGATNIAIDTNSQITVSGWAKLRLEKGQMVRFGLEQIGKSGAHATFTSAQMRVGVTKAKMYPELYHP